MFLFSRPTPHQIKEFLVRCETDVLSYPDVGITRAEKWPAGYNIDRNRVRIAAGPEGLERAKAAIRSWQMFRVPGVELVPSDTPIEVGRNVAVIANHFGFYSLNACRIVYVIDEADRFGFAYGTLTEHVEIGEERFAVEVDAASGDVWYDILAFSRPGNLLVTLGYPYARYRQRQFATESKAAMKRAMLG